MSEIFPQDIELAVITRLKDNTYGVQAYLTVIDAARSQSTPAITDANINDEMKNRNPEIVVDFMTSNEIELYFGTDIEEMLMYPGTIQVTAYLRSNDNDNIKKYMSNYVEAITKSLQGYSTGNITGINVKEFLIDDIYKNERETYKFAGVRAELLINGGK